MKAYHKKWIYWECVLFIALSKLFMLELYRYRWWVIRKKLIIKGAIR